MDRRHAGFWWRRRRYFTSLGCHAPDAIVKVIPSWIRVRACEIQIDFGSVMTAQGRKGDQVDKKVVLNWQALARRCFWLFAFLLVVCFALS
jgi:hypothetical protein